MQHLLVTGGCGFIGSNFVRYLLEESDFEGRIINIDKLNYAGNPLNLQDIEEKYPDRYVFVHGDICDAKLLLQIFEDYEIDAVCHLAAESHVDRSIANPEVFIQSNVIGTQRLLETCKLFQDRIALFHHVSTDEVFGSLDQDGFFTENTPYHPNNPYSASKAASDHLVRAYHTTYELPVTVTNCSNNYGPYQFPEKLIPLTILRLQNRENIPVYGKGAQIRDWLHVHDHARAIWTVMHAAPIGETYNVGGDGEITNLELVQHLCDLFDAHHGTSNSRDLIRFVTDRPGHDFRYAMDCSKIEKELGWTPEHNLESGIQSCLQWYQENPVWIRNVQDGSYQDWISRHYQKN